MRSLNDWNKILNGRFTNNPAIGTYLSIADTKGASIECTVLHQNGEVWHIGEQHHPRPVLPGWRSPQNLGGKGIIIEPVNTWGAAYGLGTDNHLYHHENGRWQLHDKVAQFPANAVHRSGRLGRGINNRVWLSDGTNWQDLGGEIQGRPDWVADNLIVALGSDTAIWVREETAHRTGSSQPSFGGWTSLKGEFIGNPVSISLPFQYYADPGPLKTSRMMVIVRGTPDNRLWMRELTGGRWGKWVDLGGDCQGSPSVAQIDGSNDFYCFVRGTDNRLKCLPYENGRFGNWKNWGGEISSDPVAVSLRNDDGHGARIRVFALGSDTALWERTMIISR